ncbi:hypothetical protein FRB99_002433 [Tulasnella sp. 403]|nr:hypothetical protein FRB99_002433 [Tulasnella sp. 403]
MDPSTTSGGGPEPDSTDGMDVDTNAPTHPASKAKNSSALLIEFDDEENPQAEEHQRWELGHEQRHSPTNEGPAVPVFDPPVSLVKTVKSDSTWAELGRLVSLGNQSTPADPAVNSNSSSSTAAEQVSLGSGNVPETPQASSSSPFTPSVSREGPRNPVLSSTSPTDDWACLPMEPWRPAGERRDSASCDALTTEGWDTLPLTPWVPRASKTTQRWTSIPLQTWKSRKCEPASLNASDKWSSVPLSPWVPRKGHHHPASSRIAVPEKWSSLPLSPWVPRGDRQAAPLPPDQLESTTSNQLRQSLNAVKVANERKGLHENSEVIIEDCRSPRINGNAPLEEKLPTTQPISRRSSFLSYTDRTDEVNVVGGHSEDPDDAMDFEYDKDQQPNQGVDAGNAGDSPNENIQNPHLLERLFRSHDNLLSAMMKLQEDQGLILKCLNAHITQCNSAQISNSARGRNAPASSQRKRRLAQLKVSRDIKDRDISAAIRADVRGLLHLKKGDPLPDLPPRYIRHPEEDPFYIKWDEKIGSPWNKQAIDIVLNYMVRTRPDLAGEDHGEIRQRIERHIDYLIRDKWPATYAAKPEEEREEEARLKRAKERKTRLFHRRLKTIDRHPKLGRYRMLYETLGPEGMSSDEEIEGEDGKVPKYGVYQKKWLSPAVHGLNAFMDNLADRYDQANVQKGSRFRQRVRDASRISKNADVVTNLPVNSYSASFLRKLDKMTLEILNVDPMVLDFKVNLGTKN